MPHSLTDQSHWAQLGSLQSESEERVSLVSHFYRSKTEKLRLVPSARARAHSTGVWNPGEETQVRILDLGSTGAGATLGQRV